MSENQQINELCKKYLFAEITRDEFCDRVVLSLCRMDDQALIRFAQEFHSGIVDMTDEPKATGL